MKRYSNQTDRNLGRSHSGRSKGNDSVGASPKHRFTMASLRGLQQPELSKKLYKLIKTENHAIGAYESAGREGQATTRICVRWQSPVAEMGRKKAHRVHAL